MSLSIYEKIKLLIRRNNSKYIKELLLKANSEENTYILNNCSKKNLTTENIDIAVKNGYCITAFSPNRLKNNPYLVERILEIGHESKRFLTISNCNKIALTRANIKLALKHSTCSLLVDRIKSDSELLTIALEENKKKYITHKLINSCNSEMLTQRNISLAIRKGYAITNLTPLKIKQDLKVITEIIVNSNDNTVIMTTINNCDETALSKLSSSHIKTIVDKGYYLSFYSPSVFRNNLELVKLILEKNNDSDAIKSTIDFCDETLLTEEMLIIAMEKGYKISLKTKDKVGSLIVKIKTKDYSTEHKKEIDKIIKKVGATIVAMNIDIELFSYNMLTSFNESVITKLLKYILVPKQKINFEVISTQNDIEEFKKLYMFINGNDAFELIDILCFSNFLNKYCDYKDICQQIMNNSSIKEEEKRILITKLFDNICYQKLHLDSLDEVINADNLLYIKNNQIINNSTKILEIKDIIFKVITNYEYYRFREVLSDIIDVRRTRKLINSIQDEETLKYLEKLELYLSFLEEINSTTDINFCKKVAINLNKQMLDNKKIFNDLWIFFRNFEKKSKYLYGVEILEKLTKVKEMSKVSTYDTSSTVYVVAEGINYHNQDLSCKQVKMLDITANEETPYYQFVHVLNAYGNGGRLSDIKNPRIIGKTYICLSLVSNEVRSAVVRNRHDPNSVALFFDNISPDSLIYMKHCDLFSFGCDNSLIVAGDCYFDTVSSTLAKTNNYNEYVVYRENGRGEAIYPSGIKVEGEKPTNAELIAAAYLDVPLIRAKYKDKEEVMHIDNQTISDRIKRGSIEELREIKDFLVRIKEEELSVSTEKKTKERKKIFLIN